MTRNATHICTDPTYKLVWQGYPVFMIGTTDRGCHYHPFGLAVCTEERKDDFNFVFSALKRLRPSFTPGIVLADAAEAITNGFAEVYGPPTKRIICWVHVQRNIKKRLTKLGLSKQIPKIDADFQLVQQSMNPRVFSVAANLFVEKWQGQSAPMDEFLAYFKSQWVDSNQNGWYEGYAPGCPSQNNALESTNRYLKDEHSFRMRMPIGHFIIWTQNVIKEWAIKRNPNRVHIDKKLWQSSPSIELNDYDRTRHWLLRKKDIQEITSNSVTLRITPGAKETHLSKSEAKSWIRCVSRCESWETFEQYTEAKSRCYSMCIDQDDWRNNSSCTCPYFFKKYMCKHVIGLANRLKLDDSDIPEICQQVPLGQKRKRGAPKKATAALIID